MNLFWHRNMFLCTFDCHLYKFQPVTYTKMGKNDCCSSLYLFKSGEAILNDRGWRSS